jgi:hypothetical protein
MLSKILAFFCIISLLPASYKSGCRKKKPQEIPVVSAPAVKKEIFDAQAALAKLKMLDLAATWLSGSTALMPILGGNATVFYGSM